VANSSPPAARNTAPATTCPRQPRDDLTGTIEDDSIVGTWDQEEVLQFLYTRLDPRTSGGQIIKIAPGENARLWDECLHDGVIRVGFETGDLSQYTGTDGLIRQLSSAEPTKKDSYLRGLARQLLRFRDLEPGIRIVANRGRSEILAVGTVTCLRRMCRRFSLRLSARAR
jgi:5-methylcytosine-specific restriction enzyme B